MDKVKKIDNTDKIEFISGGGVCTPLGFTASAVVADIKGKQRGNHDFALLLSDDPCEAAAVFTNNLVTAAPVKYSKKVLHESSDIFGVVANSGNANACTGAKGFDNCVKIATAVESAAELPEHSLLVASTGVIGNQMPVEKMLFKVSQLVEELDDDNGELFAKSIMTTDTFDKQVAVIVHGEKGSYTVGGCCKGAGMIDPSMATLLTFITTDAIVDKDTLKNALTSAMHTSFNSITVDGDMSTNDCVMLFANGMSVVSIKSEKEKQLFFDAIALVCQRLAILVVKDGEGATKLVTVNVKGANNNHEGKLAAAKVSNSPLVKTMFAGCDPNWGRLMSSIGASGALFNEGNVSIWFNDIHYVKNGTIIDTALEKKVYEIMQSAEYSITIDLGTGEKGECTYYTCDLTKEYVAINADYRS